MSKSLVVQPDQGPAPLKVVGEEITILAPGATTGSYEIFPRPVPKAVGRRRTAIRGTRRSMSPAAT